MNKNPLISIIIPCYNEKNTIVRIINQINKQKLRKEIILVDDYSNDGTREIIKTKIINKIKKVIFHKKNLGKGASIRSAKRFIKGDIVIIQDADLEYSPKDYKKMIKPILDGKTQTVYGSRVLGKKKYQLRNFTSIFRIFGNHVLTIASNIINGQNLTDAHTCYKVFKSKIFKKIKLCEKGFSFCPEVTSKLSNMRINILEVPISYKGRNIKEGKKIRFSDAIKAILTLIKYKIFR